MKKPDQDPRQRLVAAAADLLRQRGLHATSVRDLAKHANAPLGSTYHYFPEGKPQWVSEAVQYTASGVIRLLERELAGGPQQAMQAFFTIWRDALIASEFRAGCPVVAVVADEASTGIGSKPMAAAAKALTDWEAVLEKSLAERDVPRQQAQHLATLIIAAVEGAILICRAKRDIAPFDQVAAQLTQLVTATIAPR
jgi:AcrR family transcriptional regulator